MCETYANVLLPIPEFILSNPLCASDRPEVFDGGEYAIDAEGRKCFVIDACLVPALLALWDKGIKTTSCCCGHGSGSGVIGLLTAHTHEPGVHLSEAPPYKLYEVVERRRHENSAYERGRHDGLVEAGREDIAMLGELECACGHKLSNHGEDYGCRRCDCMSTALQSLLARLTAAENALALRSA